MAAVGGRAGSTPVRHGQFTRLPQSLYYLWPRPHHPPLYPRHPKPKVPPAVRHEQPFPTARTGQLHRASTA